MVRLKNNALFGVLELVLQDTSCPDNFRSLDCNVYEQYIINLPISEIRRVVKCFLSIASKYCINSATDCLLEDFSRKNQYNIFV